MLRILLMVFLFCWYSERCPRGRIALAGVTTQAVASG